MRQDTIGGGKMKGGEGLVELAISPPPIAVYFGRDETHIAPLFFVLPEKVVQLFRYGESTFLSTHPLPFVRLPVCSLLLFRLWRIGTKNSGKT